MSFPSIVEKLSKKSYSKKEIKLGDLYAKFNGKDITFGHWDYQDIEVLDYEDIVLLHKYLLDKIIKIQLTT